MRRLLPLLLALLAFGAAGCGDDGSGDAGSGGEAPAAEEPAPSPEPSADDYDDNAENLAVIDGEGDTDLAAVQERSEALDALEAKCPEAARSRLADFATVAKQEAEKEGVSLSTLRLCGASTSRFRRG